MGAGQSTSGRRNYVTAINEAGWSDVTPITAVPIDDKDEEEALLTEDVRAMMRDGRVPFPRHPTAISHDVVATRLLRLDGRLVRVDSEGVLRVDPGR